MTASIPLSLTEGVFVLRESLDGKVSVFTSLETLTTELKEYPYVKAGIIIIDIAELDTYDSDTVTHLVARELIGDCTDYEAWQHVNGGKFPWLEYWFDEFTTTANKADIDRRIARHNEIHGKV